jgi:ectoine hydroxylase
MRRVARVVDHLVGSAERVASTTPRLPPAPTHPAADLSGCWLKRESYARHRLSPAERRQFADEGWLMVDDALSEAEVADLTRVLDDAHHQKMHEDIDPSHPDAMNRMAVFSPANRLSNSEVVQRLLTCPAVFPKIVDILGWNIGIYHAHANVSPPRAPGDVVRDGQFRAIGDIQKRPSPDEEPTHGFHQDAARVNAEMETANHITPRLSVKAAFYLNDVSLDNAPTWVCPGSHLLTTEEWQLRVPNGGKGQPAGAIPLLAKRGSVLLFDRRLRHAATANYSDYTRRAYFIGYACVFSRD